MKKSALGNCHKGASRQKVILISGALCNKLDPSSEGGVSAKVGIDATQPLDWDVKKTTLPKEAYTKARGILEQVLQRAELREGAFNASGYCRAGELRSLISSSKMTVEIPEETSVAGLIEMLKHTVCSSPSQTDLLRSAYILINGINVEPGTEQTAYLRSGDRIVLYLPMPGG